MAWVSPTSYGTYGNWVYPERLLDENETSYGYCGSTANVYTDNIELLHAAINCSKVRIIADYAVTYRDWLAVDAYYNSAWHNVYEESNFPDNTWFEISLGATYSVTKVRIRGKGLNAHAYNCAVREFDFWEVEGGETHYGAATLSGTGALTTAGSFLHCGAATLSGAGTLAGLGRLLLGAKATLSGTGALSASGRCIVAGRATLSGTGSLTALGAYLHLATASLTGAGSLSALGQVFKLGSASLSGAGTLTTSAVAILAGKATLAGTGSLAAFGRCILAGAATLSGQGSLTVSATFLLFGKATLSGIGALSAQGIRIVTGMATLAGIGLLSAAAKVFDFMATLLAAQKKPDRLPYVEAKVYDFEQGIKRLTWTSLYNGGETDNHHGIAFDGQGAMYRIRSGGSSTLLRQKITSPGPGSDFTSWTEIATDCAGPCAIAAQGAKIYIFYRKTDNTIRKYYSHNYGVDWTNAELVSYADVLSMAAAWWSTGNIVVCFALKANELNGIVLDTSDQSNSQHTSDFSPPHTLTNTYGIGATYDPDIPGCAVVFAAQESDTPYNHYDLWRTQFSSTYHFLAIESFLMSPVGEDITYEYPDCHLPSSPQNYENTRITAVEKFTGTTAYTRPLNCHLVKGGAFSDALFTEPKPFLNISSSYGLRLITDSSYWWMERPDGVWRATRSAADPLDLTKDIISLTQSCHCEERERRGNLIIELDNHKGHFATPGSGALASLRFRSEIVLKLGYKTSAGNESSEAGTYWIDGWEYSTSLSSPKSLSSSGQSLFIIHCLDGWGLADRWSARYQMRWNKDAVGPKTVWQILHRILSRFGINLTNTPPKPQSTAINNFYPDFTIQPGTQGTQALNKLLSFVPDKLVFRGQEAFTKNPLADESSCYSYGTGHVILAGEYSEQVFTSRARAIGRTDAGARIVEDAQDWDALKLAIDILRQSYDPNLDDATRTQERADAILRRASLLAQRGVIAIPTNCGQELLDVITLTDVRVGLTNKKYRIAGIETRYQPSQAIYHQRLWLCAP